jgi:hypothetical protein
MYMNETATKRNRVANVATNRTTPFNWRLLAICSIVCCAVMMVGLIGATIQDTRLSGVETKPIQHVTNSHNTYNGVLPGALPEQQTPIPATTTTTSTPVQPVATTPQKPQTVVIQATPEPTPQQRIIYVEQPRPEPVPDTTIVIYKPEVRQPQQKIVVIDEREERIRRETEEVHKRFYGTPSVVIR